ncbi:diguanylate cyclase domain-containing protein [Paenisporosarcina cavernae]|uniref:Diguanylate cyclase n=1 Tax=Paenisporosarcina cavernae TaxID=2320858 RepID=A0A385YQV3_9BACL|nr:diguanylate cyclase [Paenisporosarcina cavernae]AYC28861.1 diguanylate cyclase [Paenisporosarcina cavernae]
MRLQVQSFAIVAFCSLAFFALFLLIFKPYYLEDANELDQIALERDVNRLNRTLENDLDLLKRQTVDLGVRDDAYLYMLDKNPLFMNEYFTGDTMENNQINLVLMLNENNELVAGRYQYSDVEDAYSVTPKYANELIREIENADNSLSYIRTSKGLYMLQMSPIKKSNGKGDDVGVMILGRLLDDHYLSGLEQNLSVDIVGSNIQTSNKPLENTFIQKNERELIGTVFIPQSERNTYTALEIARERLYYLEKKSNVNVLFILFGVLVLVYTAAIFFFMNRYIVSRVTKLSTHVNNIQQNKLKTKAIPHSHGAKDEIFLLERSINRLLYTLEMKHEEIQNLALYDALTGLPNRANIEREFPKYLKTAANMHVLFMDLDGFKAVNDSYGHRIGDTLLKTISFKIKTVVDKELGIVARIGGDEFVILLKNRTKSDMERFLKKLYQVLNETIEIDGYQLTVTPSIGISQYPENGDDYEELIEQADMAMYQAKRQGKNQYAYFQKEGEMIST